MCKGLKKCSHVEAKNVWTENVYISLTSDFSGCFRCQMKKMRSAVLLLLCVIFVVCLDVNKQTFRHFWMMLKIFYVPPIIFLLRSYGWKICFNKNTIFTEQNSFTAFYVPVMFFTFNWCQIDECRNRKMQVEKLSLIHYLGSCTFSLFIPAMLH